MTKIWEVWKPWKPEENLYTSCTDIHRTLDLLLQHDRNWSLEEIEITTIGNIYNINLATIEDLASVNLREQIARPSERIQHFSKDEVLAILSWPYRNGQKIDRQYPKFTDICAGFYDSCHRARSKVTNQMEQDRKDPKVNPHVASYPTAIAGGVLTSIGVHYISGGITEMLLVGAGMGTIIGLGGLLKSRSDYTKKQLQHFKELTRVDRSNSLIALLQETRKIFESTQE